MQTSTKDGFLGTLRSGDIALISSKNLFATIESWYAKKFNEGSVLASHGLYLREPPRIAEANGLWVSNDSSVIKYIGDTTKCWVFRYSGITPEQVAEMNAAADMAVDAGGHYSIGGILEFGLQFFGIKKHLSNENGVFCTKFTGDLITLAGLPYVPGKQTFEVDPTAQLTWFLGDGAKAGWVLVASYDGAQNYLIA
jgi:hypothetical protein